MTSETKQCTKCGVVKPATLEYFYKHGNGLRPDCKVCAAERHKARYEANKETILEQAKVYYEANKEAIVERQTTYRKANKEAIAEINKAYYKANKEAILEQAKVYREANKEAIAKQRRTHYEANKETIAEQKKAYYEANKEVILDQKKEYRRSPKGKFSQIKKGAKERNINFSLPFELYESRLWGKPCHYCGCVLEVTGLDRKDSDKGYTPDNVVPCCWGCNTKKNTKPYEEFVAEVKNER